MKPVGRHKGRDVSSGEGKGRSRTGGCRECASAERDSKTTPQSRTPSWKRTSCGNSARLTRTASLWKQGVFTRMNLSARAYDRILRVARTLCDLDAVSRGITGRGRHDRRQDKEAAHSRSRSNASARPKIFQIKEKRMSFFAHPYFLFSRGRGCR